MRMSLLRPLLGIVAILSAAFGYAGTLTVTSPTTDGFLGQSNSVTFNISGASVRVKVTLTATAPNGTVTTQTATVTPDNNGSASGSIPLNFNAGATEGAYTLLVSADESGTAYAPTTLAETVDVTAPKFTELSPVTGGFTRGNVKVRSAVEETNVDTWTVQVGSQTIASGDGNTIAADYDATTLPTDGSQSITITVKDKAGNTASRNVSLTLDRQKPTVQIVFPSNNGTVDRDLNVIVDVTDASSGSVDRTGVDVIVKKTDGTFVTRVTLVSLRATNGTTQRWTGRVRYKKGQFPSRFKVSVSAVDRAGNSASLQEVTVRTR